MIGLENRPSDTRVDRVVVCVCTKDRPIMFRRCLDSILHQRVSDGSIDLHLLIVDNSAHGGVRETVKQYGDTALPIAYIHEPRAGIPVARNAALSALEHTSPDWIAFIDDDEIAPRDWIARLHAIAVHSRADVASGMLIQLLTPDEAQAAADAWQPGPSLPKIAWRKTCATSNVMFRTWLVNEPYSLRFDEAMHHGGSDTEFFMRAKLRGARIAYVKDAPVFEEYPPERQTFSYQCQRAFRVGATYNYRHRKNLGPLVGLSMAFGRASYKALEAGVGVVRALAVFPFSREASARHIKRSARSAVFAFGCIGPVFGINTTRYW